ncbi:beta-glucuronidase [soil metagenome]
MGGIWDFVFLGQVDLDQISLLTVEYTERVLVPSSFDAMPTHAGKRGAALYRTILRIPVGHEALIEFGAVSIWSRIYVDGRILEENGCGYAPFQVRVPAAEFEQRELTVLVDNRFDFDRVPMHEEYFDFYQYGGILREVFLRILPEKEPWIEYVRVTPTKGYREGDIEVTVKLRGEKEARVALGFQFDEGDQQVVEVSGLENVFKLKVPNPRIWSTSSPQMHRLSVAVQGDDGGDGDRSVVRFGLRVVEARAGALWLNEEKVVLRGYNRHEWHPNYGPCTPKLQMAADLEWLKALGCNFVRGSHYPQDQRFLDLCDEFGFLVWEENLGWGQKGKTFASEKFCRDHQKSLEAMVATSYNHPSIIIWGFLNESASDTEHPRAVFEKTVATLRQMDPSRLVSYATNVPTGDKFLHLADVISLNLYPGWYECEGVEDPIGLIGPYLRRTLESLDERGFGDKPVILSEIGAEGLYGWHEAHNDFFSEEYQAKYLRTACEAVLNNPRWSGIALWHFSDVRTYGGGWSLRRPRTFNNKGTLDEYRRPKAAFAVVRDVFQRHGSGG